MRNFKIIKFTALSIIIVLMFLNVACSSQSTNTTTSNTSTSGGTANNASKKTITWEYFGFMAPTNVMLQQAKEFAEEVKKKTNGQLEIIVRPGGELPYNVAEVPVVVGKGQVQMGDNLVAYSSGLLKVGPISTLPFLSQTFDETKKVRDVLKPYVEKEYNEFGATVLYSYPWPQQQLWGSGEPIKSLNDVNGKKMRVVGAEWGDLIKMLGGIPVTVGPTEVPTAIERGVMDGFHTAATTVATNGWQEFTKWEYKADISVGGISYIIANKKAMDELPDDLRNAIIEVAKQHEEKIWADMPKIDEENQKKLADSGIKVFQASPEDRKKGSEMLSSYWNEWAAKRSPIAVEALAKVREALGK
jgi:TRAP-type transport system periplasmic protein